MNTADTTSFGEYHRTENVASLLLDVYLIPSDPSESIETLFTGKDILFELADLAVQLNTYIQRHNVNVTEQQNRYRWLSGGDGPVFGIHCSPSSSIDPSNDVSHKQRDPNGTYMIPHLRTSCRYGVCVNDEWSLIGLVLDFFRDRTTSLSLGPKKTHQVVLECWDLDDGQILLIEGSQHIPKWVDDISPNNCSHRCWISTSNLSTDQKGFIKLLRPKESFVVEPVTLGDAIRLLAWPQSTENNSFIECAPYAMEEAIMSRIKISSAESVQCHRSAVVLPQAVVQLFQHRPDLISTACQMFVEHIQDSIHIKKLEDYMLGTCNNWIWTTLTFGRTAYAMLRTTTSKPDWIQEDVIVPSVLMSSSLEVKRYQRQCAVEATPHLRYGIQLGVRLLAGLHHCLHVRSKLSKVYVEPILQPLCGTVSSAERRILMYWSEVMKKCRNVCSADDEVNSEETNWIIAAWHAGPNNAKYDLTSMMECPVFAPEIESSITPLTTPDVVLAQQIRNELLRKQDDAQYSANPPHHTKVDSDEWMWTLPTSNDGLLPDPMQDVTAPQKKSSKTLPDPAAAIDTSAIDEMLCGVQTFMTGTSTMKGVDTREDKNNDRNRTIDVNSTVFMNILHTALKSSSAKELSDKLNAGTNNIADDPYFTQEDYTLMDPSDDENESDEMNMADVMNVMDFELREATSIGRDWDNVDSTGGDNDIAHNTHILENLFKSIGATGGGPGPIRNMLQEMGSDVPHFETDDNDVEDD
jgi:SGT1 protein